MFCFCAESFEKNEGEQQLSDPDTEVAVILNGAIDFPAKEHYEIFQLTHSAVASVQLMVYIMIGMIIVRFAFTILKLHQRIEFRYSTTILYSFGDRPETMRKSYTVINSTSC